MTIASTSFAQHHHHHRHGYWKYDSGRQWQWVAPVIIGGVIGYEIAKTNPPQTVIIQQPPPTALPPMNTPDMVCSPWTQIINSDGTVTYTRTCQK